MSTQESTIQGGAPPDASGIAESSTSTVTDTSSVGTSSAQQSTADTASVDNVQESQSTTSQESDPFAGVPSIEELQTAADRDTPYAKSLIQLRNALEPLKTQYSELQTRYKPFESVIDKFSAPEEVQQLVDMRESLMGWERNEQNQLVPSTQKFIESLDPQRANFLFADFIDSKNPVTGESRVNDVIKYLAANPDLRASALQALGGVEPSAVAPQWQPTDEQLAVVKPELQDTFKKLPYDEREELATMSPEFINNSLAKQKLQDDLVRDREQRVQQDTERQQQYEQALQQEAAQAGESYVDNLISTGLTTFHNSVVEQCNFIAPLDPANLPDGMSPEQAAQMNAQISEANKAEAAQITSQIVALINPQTRRYMLPTLKEIGVVDDKLMAQIDAAAEATGNNGRNYGHLLHQGQRTANGQGYKPGPDVTPLDNEAQRNFKLLVHYANQIKGRLMEKRSQFFAMKATGHNSLLNGVATSRPNANGGSYDPTTAAVQQPQGWLSRDEIARQYS